MTKRSKTLDILRAVAIIIVLGRHIEVCPPELSPWLFKLTSLWEKGGWCGVDLFFVLSGFLISGLLFKEHQKYDTIQFKRFFIRRWLKIYPTFIALIIATVIYDLVAEHHVPLGSLASELLFIQNYRVGLWNHTWSLAVEEHFYLLLPALFILSLRSKSVAAQSFRWLPGAFAAVAVVCLALRLVTATRGPFDAMKNLFPTHLRIDSLLAGVLVSYCLYYYRDKFLALSQRFFPIALLLGILPFTLPFIFKLEDTPFLYTFGLSLLWLGASLVLFAVADKEPKDNLFSTTLAFIGSRSYSIYIWHMPVATWGVSALNAVFHHNVNWYAYLIFYLLGSVLVGTVMAYVIEYPVIKLRDRMFPSRTQPVEPAAEPALAA